MNAAVSDDNRERASRACIVIIIIIRSIEGQKKTTKSRVMIHPNGARSGTMRTPPSIMNHIRNTKRGLTTILCLRKGSKLKLPVGKRLQLQLLALIEILLSTTLLLIKGALRLATGFCPIAPCPRQVPCGQRKV